MLIIVMVIFFLRISFRTLLAEYFIWLNSLWFHLGPSAQPANLLSYSDLLAPTTSSSMNVGSIYLN